MDDRREIRSHCRRQTITPEPQVLPFLLRQLTLASPNHLVCSSIVAAVWSAKRGAESLTRIEKNAHRMQPDNGSASTQYSFFWVWLAMSRAFSDNPGAPNHL